MKRRQFLNSSLLAAAVSLPGIRAAYAVVGTGTVANLPAITGDGREIILKGADIRDLGARMRGRLLVAGDDGYDKARLVSIKKTCDPTNLFRLNANVQPPASS